MCVCVCVFVRVCVCVNRLFPLKPMHLNLTSNGYASDSQTCTHTQTHLHIHTSARMHTHTPTHRHTHHDFISPHFHQQAAKQAVTAQNRPSRKMRHSHTSGLRDSRRRTMHEGEGEEEEEQEEEEEPPPPPRGVHVGRYWYFR